MSQETLEQIKELPEVEAAGPLMVPPGVLIGKPIRIESDAEGVQLVVPNPPSRTPRKITADKFHEALIAAGVIREGESIRRIVIDAQAGNAVKVHVERYGDERLLDVVRTLDGVQVYGERR